MSQIDIATTVAQQNSAQTGSALEVKPLSFIEGVAVIVGTTIGAGILSMAYASRKAGYLPLLFWLILVGIISTLSMLYVAESTLRTREHHQLSGLAQRYLGKAGAWAIFCAVIVNTLGALTAYMSGSGSILAELLGIPAIAGSLLFFIPSVLVLWLGLKALGRAEKAIAFCMVLLLIILVSASLLVPSSQFSHLLEGDWLYMVPIFNVVVFSFQAQFIVPELARGFAHKPRLLMPAIVTGMGITFLILALLPLSVLILTGLDKVTDVATLAWGQELGQWAFYTANLFALCAMLTSYWGMGSSCLTNIFDKLSLGHERNPQKRLLVLAFICVPPLLLSAVGAVGFVNALYFAGVFSGFIFAALPILILHRARRSGDHSPAWSCNAVIFHPIVQWTTIILYTCSVLYALCSQLGWLPAGW